MEGGRKEKRKKAEITEWVLSRRYLQGSRETMGRAAILPACGIKWHGQNGPEIKEESVSSHMASCTAACLPELV